MTPRRDALEARLAALDGEDRAMECAMLLSQATLAMIGVQRRSGVYDATRTRGSQRPLADRLEVSLGAVEQAITAHLKLLRESQGN